MGGALALALAPAFTGGETSSRVLVLHVDDVGMCHGANQAYLELARAGQVTTGSVMVPCPWFREIADATADTRPAGANGTNAALDLGVHLTLTSEWPHYRWAPLSTRRKSSGLVDDQGYFPRNCLELRPRLVPEAAEIEFRAQIERALAAGIDVTHLDTHMGAALVPELVGIYVRLGREYGLPILLPRDLDSYTSVLRMGETPAALYQRTLAELSDAGLPLFDRFLMTPGAANADVEATYRSMIETLPGGASFFALHCNAPGDIEAIVPPRAHWRTDEYRLFGSGLPRRWIAEAGIRTVGMREVRDLWRAALPA